jgi:glycosyltransferase involved in cell wall biosynthesis
VLSLFNIYTKVMIKVLFDHQIFDRQTYGGISRYFANLIRGSEGIEEIEIIKGWRYTNNYYLEQTPTIINELLRATFLRNSKNTYKKNNSYCKRLLNSGNFDIFHPTYFDPYFLDQLTKPLVITIHDMTYEEMPEYFPNNDPLPTEKRLLANRADKIIAISETTKTDIIKHLQIDENKIHVIPHGIDHTAPAYEEVENLPENYLLFVGSRSGYKNFFMLARAFKQLNEKHKDLVLMLAGGGPLESGDAEFLIRNGIFDKTRQISATDAQLNTLYKKAICFVFPSRYEGFGFPILEAFKNNCPVLLSNCSCFPEIAGDAALYFDVNAIDDLIRQLMVLINNEAIRNTLIEQGQAKLQNYTLAKCTAATINLYKALQQETAHHSAL